MPLSRYQVSVALFLSAFLLIGLTIFWGAVTWLLADLVDSGLDARMMTFESEPSEGYNYWRWHFFKQSLPGNLVVFGMIGLFWIILGFGWFKLIQFSRRIFSRHLA